MKDTLPHIRTPTVFGVSEKDELISSSHTSRAIRASAAVKKYKMVIQGARHSFSPQQWTAAIRQLAPILRSIPNKA
jgi:hypothetical protein